MYQNRTFYTRPEDYFCMEQVFRQQWTDREIAFHFEKPWSEHLLLRVEFLLKTDSGYPKDMRVNKPWQPLRIPFAITLIGRSTSLHPRPFQGT